jgi:hypothetical protein
MGHEKTSQDVYALSKQLAEDCEKTGLKAEVLAPTRVRISDPAGHARLTEVVRCMPLPYGDERLMWWWSWDEPICPAADIPGAVKAISSVVTSPDPGAR